MSLRRLKIDTIDLYQLHRIDSKVPLEEQIGILTDMQKAGKIRHIGLSEVDVPTLKKVQELATIVSVQNLYNLSNKQSEEVLNYSEENNIGFIPWFPVAGGDLVKPGGILDETAKSHGATVARRRCRLATDAVRARASIRRSTTV